MLARWDGPTLLTVLVQQLCTEDLPTAMSAMVSKDTEAGRDSPTFGGACSLDV